MLAFTAVESDDSVVTWGQEGIGRNPYAVREQLAGDVQHIYSATFAFAAMESDGSVVTWGYKEPAGNFDAAVREQLACLYCSVK